MIIRLHAVRYYFERVAADMILLFLLFAYVTLPIIYKNVPPT